MNKMKTTNPEVDAIEKLSRMIAKFYIDDPNQGVHARDCLDVVDEIKAEMILLKSKVRIQNTQIDLLFGEKK